MRYIALALFLSFLTFMSCSNDDSTLAPSNVAFQISIQSQEDLDNIDFSRIDTINGPLTIRNTSITDLNFLSGICVTGRIDIFGNDSLTTLSGIENLECVSELIITQNSNLRNVQALDNLEISKHLTIRNNGLENIEPLRSLINIEGQIFISESNLKDYRLFRNLEETNSLILGGSLAENLDDLENLQVVNSELIIRGNPRLVDYCGIKSALLNSGDITFETNLGNSISTTMEEVINECN